MKVDVSQSLCGLDGTGLKEEDQPVLLRAVCINALMATLEQDKNQSGEDKLKAWMLAKKIQDEDEVDLTPEELTLLKTRIGKCFGPIVVGPAYEILNG